MTLKECYEIIGGDYEDVLSRIPKESMVEKFLIKFTATTDFDEMLEAFEKKDYRKVFETSHNLKGMSANLSLKKSFETVQTICEAVRKGDPEIDLEPYILKATEEHELILKTVAELD